MLRDGELSSPRRPRADQGRLVAADGGRRAGIERAGRSPAKARRGGRTRGGPRRYSTVAEPRLADPTCTGAAAGVSLQVRAGEVVGVTGLLSAGVATSAAHRRGREKLRRRGPVRGGSSLRRPRDIAQRAGIGYVPEDRRAEGFVAHLGVAENATMTITDRLADRFGCWPGPAPGRRRRPADRRRLSLVASGRPSPSTNCPAATSRRSPSPGPWRTTRRSSSRLPRPAASTWRPRNCCSPARRRARGQARRGRAALHRRAFRPRHLRPDRRPGPRRGLYRVHRAPFDRDELIVATEGISGPTHDTPGTAAEEAKK